jgi:hypothetical protein
MKKILFSALALCSFMTMKAQFPQTFNTITSIAPVTVGTGSWNVGGLPTGWTQSNGDNLTPLAALVPAFGTNAWITRALTYSDGTKDTFAVSTSYYTPAGVSNDWLISPSFTPTAGQFLLFKGLASNANYADGFKVKVSTTGNAVAGFTTDLLTVTAESATSWTTHAINLSAYVGQSINIAIVNNSNDKELLMIDDFELKTLPAADAAVLAMTPSVATYKSYANVGGVIAVQGLLYNYGSAPITSYNVKINDGISTQTFPQTGNIASYASTVFSLNYTLGSVGIKPIKMWVELTGDMNHVNDTTSSEFGAAAFTPTLTQVFEEGTGTWCQWCPRGAVYMDSMAKVHPEAVLIAVHNGTNDPMKVATYDAGMGGLIGGYPSGLTGRKEELDPSEFLTAYTAHANDFGVADLTVSQPTISGSTMSVKVDVKMAVNTKANYDYRLALVITQDKMKGTTAGWNQANAYAGGAAGVMGGYETKANPVPAAQMIYDHVARNIEGGFNGVAGSLPAVMTAGQTYTYTFNTAIPAGVNLFDAKANVLLISALSGEVQNGKWKSAYPTAINNVLKNATLSLFPNPTADFINLEFSLTEATDVTINVTDLTGKVVYSNNLVNKIGNQGLVINAKDFSNGIYLVSLKTATGNLTQKVTVSH